MLRIGIFGGTFDPPHIGHSILAAEACFQLALDRLIWVLTPIPPHKLNQWITPLEDRLALVEAAIENDPWFSLSRIEIDRPGPHFAVDTVRLLREQNPEAELIYLMGGDSLHDLPVWHRPVDFVNEVDGIGVMRRVSDAIEFEHLEGVLPGITKKVALIETPLVGVSASLIRERISQNQPYRYFVLPAVYDLIVARGLYKTTGR